MMFRDVGKDASLSVVGFDNNYSQNQYEGDELSLTGARLCRKRGCKRRKRLLQRGPNGQGYVELGLMSMHDSDDTEMTKLPDKLCICGYCCCTAVQVWYFGKFVCRIVGALEIVLSCLQGVWEGHSDRFRDPCTRYLVYILMGIPMWLQPQELLPGSPFRHRSLEQTAYRSILDSSCRVETPSSVDG